MLKEDHAKLQHKYRKVEYLVQPASGKDFSSWSQSSERVYDRQYAAVTRTGLVQDGEAKIPISSKFGDLFRT